MYIYVCIHIYIHTRTYEHPLNSTTFKEQQRNLPQPVDQHFAESLDELKKIEGEAKQAQKKKPTKKTASKKKPSKKSPRKKKGKDED